MMRILIHVDGLDGIRKAHKEIRQTHRQQFIVEIFLVAAGWWLMWCYANDSWQHSFTSYWAASHFWKNQRAQRALLTIGATLIFISASEKVTSSSGVEWTRRRQTEANLFIVKPDTFCCMAGYRIISRIRLKRAYAMTQIIQKISSCWTSNFADTSTKTGNRFVLIAVAIRATGVNLRRDSSSTLVYERSFRNLIWISCFIYF